MLRRLLSNPTVGGGGEGSSSAEEPREYILLSKMQPLPPEPYQQAAAASLFPANDLPPGHNPWHQLDTSPSPFHLQTNQQDPEIYWPNFSYVPNFNPMLHGLAMTTSPAPPPPLPFPITPQHFLANPAIQNARVGSHTSAFTELLNADGPSSANQLFAKSEPVILEQIQTKKGREPKEKLLASSTDESSTESPSPENCPYCNRSFDPSRSSLRRHMAQCRRIKGSPSDGPIPKRPRTPLAAAEKKPRLNTPAAASSSATVDPSDPYQCQWCRFNTLYKGNMKRHLICCHRVPSDVLCELNFNVERLRKLAQDRPALDELPIQPRRDEKGKERGGEEAEEEEDRQMAGKWEESDD